MEEDVNDMKPKGIEAEGFVAKIKEELLGDRPIKPADVGSEDVLQVPPLVTSAREKSEVITGEEKS